MPTPSTRTPLRIARGTYANLNGSVADIQEGEICYATDQDKLYVKESGSLVAADGVNNAVLDAAQTFTAAQRGAITALTDGATITPDFAAGNNYSVTLGGNRTLANPTNLTAGQSGVIMISQDGTGSRTLAFGNYWKFAGGTAPSLTTTASAVDVIAFFVDSTTRISAQVLLNVS
tara:strand:- start:3900 stop:4424 length:525 start_codon:yes stop_codon:yes gene_type:complete